MRTDFTQEIDGAFADRNLGMRHFSEVARSGNGDMRTDLSEDLANFQELVGVGEGVEPMTQQESAAIDSLGAAAPAITELRWPVAGEVPPFAAKPGSMWMRRRVATGTRAPGGPRLVRLTWVQVTQERLNQLRNKGALDGLGMGMGMELGLSVALGLVGGLGIWWMLKHKKKA